MQIEKQIDIATTLMARDYKGFGNQSMNGVIEWKYQEAYIQRFQTDFKKALSGGGYFPMRKS